MGLLRNFGMAAAFVLAAPTVGAQQPPTVLNFDDLACTSTPLSTYQSWISLFDGTTCTNHEDYWIRAASPSNYIVQSNGGDIGWSFLNGPVTLDGMWASGIGSYLMEMLSGGQVVYAHYFGVFVTPRYITSNYTGSVDEVRISWRAGMNAVGIDNITFRPLGQNSLNDPGNGGDPSEPFQSGDPEDPPTPPNNPPTPPNNPPTPPNNPPSPPNDPPGGGGSLDPISNPSVTPEPATLVLVATGLGGIGAVVRRRRRKP